MKQSPLPNHILDNSKDIIWAVDSKLSLVYANKPYLSLMKEVTGVEKELNTPVLVEGFGEGGIEKWESYYQRAFSGEYFKIEEHFYNPKTKEMQYGHITFSPIRDEPGEILTVTCRSTDITPGIRQNDHAGQLMDASLDVFCTIDEAGKFVFVSAASADHWGYHPEELTGKPFRDFIIEEDRKKTDLVAAEILAGKEFKSFSNRYHKKNGDIAYNLWSARWNNESKLMYCVARDEKDKIEEEAEKELLSQISLSFNSEEELIPAANRLCENIYAFGKFDLIELWCPNMEQTQIKLMGHSTHNQDFYELELSEASFQKNEGMPGKVWKKGKQLFWDKKQIDKHFIRKKGASHLGLQAILGIPLTFNDELVGVLLIGTKRDPDYLKQRSSALSQLEKFIGSEINRKRLENDLRNVFDTIPEILCITDFEGRFLKINSAGCAMLGYTTNEVLFHSLDEFTLKEDKGKFDKNIKDITKEASVFAFENRFLSKDGQVIWLSWNCNTATEEGLVYASAKNITAEVQLRELNAQAGSMAKIGSWEVNLKKNTVFWSKMVHQLHETDADSFIPDLETAIDFYREDFRPLVSKSIEKSITTGEGFDFEAVIITQKLKERWVRAIGNVEIANGKTKRIFGSFQDITDRKESELRLQALSDDLPGVTFQYVIMPDGQDSMRSVSKASSKIWGLSAEVCEKDNNKVWEQINKAGDLDEVQQSIQQSIASGEKWHFRWRNVLPTGELRWHEGFGTPNHLADGTVIFNSMIFDITDEKKAVLLYEETADTARLGTWEIDLISRKVYLSKVTREIHELDEKTEISIEDGLNFYKESFREVVRKTFQNGIENGEAMEFELPIITVKDNERWVRVIGQAEIIEDKVVRLFGSFQDIHQRKIAELRLQSITNDLPGVVFQYHLYPDGTERLFTVSKGSQHIWGLSPQQCEADINLVWEQVKKGGDYEQVVQDITHSIQTMTQWHSKWRNVLPDGTVRWHEGFGTPYFQPDGTVTFNSLVFDYTDEKLAIDLYQHALAEKATILESISDAFYAVDSNWNFTYFNREAENLLKKSADEVLGENIWEIFSPAKGTTLEDLYKKVASTGQSENFEYYYPGDGCWYEITVYSSSGGVSSYFKNIDERRKTAQELEKAYKEKNKILESIGDAFFAVDEAWTVTYWNKQAETILGKMKKDIVDKNLWEEFPDAIDTDFYRQYHRAMETGEIVNFEAYYPTLDMWIEVTVYPSENGLSIYFKDITLKKAADIRLLEANERFELVTKATNDAIWDWDIENDTFYRSQNIYKFFGKEVPTTLTSKEFWNDSFHPDDLKTIKESISKALKDKQTERWEIKYRVLNEKGNTVYVADRGLIIRDSSDKAVRMIGAMVDITELKSANIELIRQTEFINTMTDNQLAAIIACNADGDLILFNKTAKEWHGVDAMKVTQDKWAENYDLYRKDGINLLDKSEIPLVKAFNGEKVKNDEIIIKKKSEKPRIVLCNGSSFHDNNGEKLGAVVIMTDITERKKAERELLAINEKLSIQSKELQRSNEELEQFAFITSHDLQEPLRMISGFMDQLKRKYADQLDDKALQYIHFASDGAKRMKQIILDLLLYSRANKPSDVLEVVNLNDILSDFKQLRVKLIKEKNALFECEQLPEISTHRAPITQIFHSILDNALKYSKKDKTPVIKITAVEKDKEWEFAIRDNGIGIDPQFYDKIFVIFQRLHNREAYDGTGIGLSIAKRSVEFLGGRIWLKSKLGEGTTFYFTISKYN